MPKNNHDENPKEWFGMPMRWDRKNMFKNLWNKDDDRIFPPKYFGIGWDLNLHALFKQVGLVERTNGNE
jgi:hypothetical protein